MGVHTFECPFCKKEGFLGFWLNTDKYKSPMEWSCSFCGQILLLLRTEFKVSD